MSRPGDCSPVQSFRILSDLLHIIPDIILRLVYAARGSSLVFPAGPRPESPRLVLSADSTHPLINQTLSSGPVL